jgi:hypothetical protein
MNSEYRRSEQVSNHPPYGVAPHFPQHSADGLVEGDLGMQVPVDVTDEIRSEAEARGVPIVDYVEMLVARGRQALEENSHLSSAIERIRALRPPESLSRR